MCTIGWISSENNKALNCDWSISSQLIKIIYTHIHQILFWINIIQIYGILIFSGKFLAPAHLRKLASSYQGGGATSSLSAVCVRVSSASLCARRASMSLVKHTLQLHSSLQLMLLTFSIIMLGLKDFICITCTKATFLSTINATNFLNHYSKTRRFSSLEN